MYQKKTGKESTITVKEVDKIKNDKDARKPPPIAISYVKPKMVAIW